MAKILNEFQSDQIKTIRNKIRRLHLDYWMCEGGDYETLNIFNNALGVLIIADYYGNIQRIDDCDYVGNKPFEPSADLRLYIKYEGQIAQICEFGKMRD